jgi:hypothetical protein
MSTERNILHGKSDHSSTLESTVYVALLIDREYFSQGKTWACFET